jgi:hypothetical protein
MVRLGDKQNGRGSADPRPLAICGSYLPEAGALLGGVEGAGLEFAGAGVDVLAPLPVVVGGVAGRLGVAEPVVVVAGELVGAVATLLPFPPQPAHHQTPMPIATSTMMPMIHAPELSSRTRRVLLFGS